MIKIEILGAGCDKCTLLAEKTEEAAKEISLDYSLTKVSEISEILDYGVMITPALVVNGVVKVSGRVPANDELKSMLKD